MSDISDEHQIDLKKLEEILEVSMDDSELFRTIVNAPFEFKLETAFLFLGIIVLLQVDTETGTIDRIALSNTELAKNTTDVSFVEFSKIKIPIDYLDNILAKAISTKKPQDTTDWEQLFVPVMTGEQARINQASAGISYSAVYPLKSREGGAMIFSYFQYSSNVGKAQHDFMEGYSQLVDKRLAV